MNPSRRRLLVEQIVAVAVLECGMKVDATALMAVSEEKLCSRLVSEFGRVFERRKLTIYVGKTKVMRCSRYGNGR